MEEEADNFLRPSIQITSVNDRSSESGERDVRARAHAHARAHAPSHRSFLYEMCKRWAWEVVIQRCRSHPHEASHVISDASGDTALHVALIGNPPALAIRCLLDACPELASTRNSKQQYPLRLAASYRSSGEVVRLLIQAYPQAAGVQDHRGSYPLHVLCDYGCSVDSIVALLESHEGRQSIDKVDRVFRRTPLQILHERLNLTEFHRSLALMRRARSEQQVLEQLIDHSVDQATRARYLQEMEEIDTLMQMKGQVEYWEKAKHIISAQCHGRHPQNDNLQRQTVVHACLRMQHCPISLIEFAVLLRTCDLTEMDYSGQLPIHLAISISPASIVDDILRACPQAASITNGSGELPLQQILSLQDRRFYRNDTAFQLLCANPNALNVLNLHVKLYPAIWSRIGRHRNMVDKLYMSIRGSPDVFCHRLR